MQSRTIHAADPSGLPAGFQLRPVVTDQDADRYADLNQAVTGEGEIARRLIDHRPGARRDDFVMVLERDTGRAVSTTCLLPWQLSYEGVTLNAAMLEMVVTDPGYRRHGLVRAQVQAFHERARTRGMDLCIIQGIPFYYRQFGYGYALDHYPFFDLSASLLPDACRAKGLKLRACVPADTSVLCGLYEQELSRQGMYVRRSGADWDYLQSRAGRPAELIVRTDGGAPVGYLCARSEGERLVVAEAGLRDPGDAPAALALLASRAPRSVEICGNRTHSLCRAAADRGSTPRDPDQWLVRIIEPATFLARLAPVFEERLRQADFGRLDAKVTINTYRSAVRVTVAGGRIAGVAEVGFIDASMGADGGDLCIPPDAFTRLVFGYRDLDELRDAWPDTSVRAGSRPVLDALFPRRDSLVLMPY